MSRPIFFYIKQTTQSSQKSQKKYYYILEYCKPVAEVHSISHKKKIEEKKETKKTAQK
jgi:hypothetical protein